MFVIEREVVHSENHAYEVTKCFSTDGWSVAVAFIHRYPKLTSELRNRSIIRVGMKNLSMVIWGIKIEITMHQNFLPRMPSLWGMLVQRDDTSSVTRKAFSGSFLRCSSLLRKCLLCVECILRWWSTNCEMRSEGLLLLETMGRPGLCILGKM